MILVKRGRKLHAQLRSWIDLAIQGYEMILVKRGRKLYYAPYCLGLLLRYEMILVKRGQIILLIDMLSDFLSILKSLL